MIFRIIIPLMLLIALPDVYIWMRQLRKPTFGRMECVLWLLPSAGLMVFTLLLAIVPNFVPDNIYWINLYIALLGVWVIPKFVYTLCAAIGHGVCRLVSSHRNWGKAVGMVLALYIAFVVTWGYVVGFGDIRVHQVDLDFSDLPDGFDGLRIVQFSDAHVGTYTGRRMDILRRAVDSINAQHPDVICFTGDIQNVQPSELVPVLPLLSQLRAPMGVYSVLGNHDYSMYLNTDEQTRHANEQWLCQMERQMGWTLLLDEHRTLRRGADSIFIAGMENDGEPPFPAKGDVARTVKGIPHGAFTLMLQHDPSAWQCHIIPKSEAQLTLSGHTHGGQIEIFGFRFTHIGGKRDLGLYRLANRYLYVSGGLGGVLPLRYGVEPEITLFVLHQKR